MKKYILPALVLLITSNVMGQPAPRAKHFNLDNGLAIQGYDPVAYFTQNKAVKGTSQFKSSVDGVTYHFSSAADKALFDKSPAMYEPQYGGWCAYAMGAANEKVEIDPETFKIINGKLFLFYHSWVNNTLTKWNKDEQNLHSRADANWAKLFK